MIRSVLFNIAYWVLSVLYALTAAAAMALPGRGAVTWVVRRYSRGQVRALRWIAGIKLRVEGRDKVPAACIIAAKHHSWFDGFCMYSQFDDLAIVTGDHLTKLPLLSGILDKLGAIVVNSCGGRDARDGLIGKAEAAAREGRPILIYPEGHLTPPGERRRYKSGVWRMYQDFGLPVVPAATNLGLFAPQHKFEKHPGTAVLAFLDPIEPGLGKAAFMERLETAIETRSDALIAEALGREVIPSVLVPDPPDTSKAASAEAPAT